MPENEYNHEVRIHIDEHHYQSPTPTTGAALYMLGKVAAGMELYREVRGDHIENVYTLKVINLDDRVHDYRLEVSGMDGLEIAAPVGVIEAAPGSVSTIPARLQAPEGSSGGVHHILLTLRATDQPRIGVREKARFIGPMP